MDYILKSRGYGKSFDLINRSNKTRERIVCANRNMAKYVNEKANDMGLIIPEAIWIGALKENGYDYSGEKFLIDELSACLNQMLSANVSAIADTPDSIIIETKDLSKNPDSYTSHYIKK